MPCDMDYPMTGRSVVYRGKQKALRYGLSYDWEKCGVSWETEGPAIWTVLRLGEVWCIVGNKRPCDMDYRGKQKALRYGLSWETEGPAIWTVLRLGEVWCIVGNRRPCDMDYPTTGRSVVYRGKQKALRYGLSWETEGPAIWTVLRLGELWCIVGNRRPCDMDCPATGRSVVYRGKQKALRYGLSWETKGPAIWTIVGNRRPCDMDCPATGRTVVYRGKQKALRYGLSCDWEKCGVSWETWGPA
ncbi:hypothetical protein N7540_012516 [Penicillium herquei]|nr:hypothetical protein N7540_012516 [Penicillium herquei]